MNASIFAIARAISASAVARIQQSLAIGINNTLTQLQPKDEP